MKQTLLSIVLSLLMRLLYRTLRLQVHVASADGAAESMTIETLSLSLRRGFLFAFWHGTMLTGWLFARQFLKQLLHSESAEPQAVVSLSKDGELLSGALRRLRFDLIRGSSSKGGEEVKVLVREALRRGQAIAITPDGPRGPREVFKYGSVRLASETGRAIVFARITHHDFWQLKSWDRFEIPKPFSRADVRLSLIAVPPFFGECGEADLKNFTDALTAQFSNSNHPDPFQTSSATKLTSV